MSPWKGAGGQILGYDQNGSLTSKVVYGAAYLFSYDAENRLTGVSGKTTAAFTYDGDGKRVQSVIGATTTSFVGSYFEWTGSTSSMKKYYYAGSLRLAMRTGTGTGNTNLTFLTTDHLGSTSATYRADNGATSPMRYMPWGEQRDGSLTTRYTYTGQYSNVADFGLLFYNARWYDPALGRFAQADSIVPEAVQGVQAWDRYAYVNNSPYYHS